MKVRRLTIEVEIPWMFHPRAFMECLRVGLNTTLPPGMKHQAQIIKDEELEVILNDSTQVL